MNLSNKKFKLILIISSLLIITSCALKPIPSEFSFVRDAKKVNLDTLGDGKILIYNGADALHKIDNTGRLNIWIENKALGQIRLSEYVVVNLKKGKQLFKALHIDVLKMRSEHEVLIDNSVKIIKIKPTGTSNRLDITNVLPNNFEKFRYASN